MTDHENRWAAVQDHVAAAMKKQRLSQAELVRASGVSDFTVRKVMNGTPGNYRPDRLAKIAYALGWEADGIERILDGGFPVQRGLEPHRAHRMAVRALTPEEGRRHDELLEWVDSLKPTMAAQVNELADLMYKVGRMAGHAQVVFETPEVFALWQEELATSGRPLIERDDGWELEPEQVALAADKGKAAKPAKRTRKRPSPEPNE